MLLPNSFNLIVIERYFRSFAIIPDRAFAISSLFLELQRFKIYERIYARRYQKL